jgi:gas vesicle protein
MTERIADRIATVKAELDQFPDPPQEPNHVVMKLIEQFARCLSSHIDAGSDDNPFRMQFDDLLLAFSKQLQASKLEVGMNISKGSNEKDVGVTQVRNTKKVSTQTKKRAGDATSCKRVKPSPFVASTGRVVYKLDDLRMRYNRGATNSIPGSINDKVTEQLIRDSCIEWKDIVAKLLKDVSSLVRRMISDSKEEALSEWTYTELSKEIQQKTLAYFNKTIATEGEGINQHLSRMYAYPGTLNNDFETFNRSHLRSLLDQRYPKESDKLAKARSKIPNPYDVPLEQYSKEARDANSQWTNERLADDQFGSRLQCVATIHTHHDILSSNLADTASMQLKYDVVAKLHDEAAGMLRAELNVLDTVRCAALLAEDPAREKRRKLLLTEEAKLEKAMRIIDDLQGTE